MSVISLLPPDGDRTPVRRDGPAGAPAVRMNHAYPSFAASPSPEEGPMSLARLFWRRKWTVAGSAVLCAAAAFGVSRLQRPVFRATIALEIQGLKDDSSSLGSADPIIRSASFSDDNLGTQIDIIRSGALIERVARRLGIEARFEQAAKTVSPPSWAKWLSSPAARPEPARDQAVNSVLSNLDVQSLRGTRIIRIRYDSTDPQEAADVANALGQEFIERNLELRIEASKQTGSWLAGQLEELRRKLRDSENNLQAYARSAGIIVMGEKDNLYEERLRQVQAELGKAQADRMAAQSRYERIKQSAPEALPEVLDSGSRRDFDAKLAELRRELVDLEAQYTPAHYRVQRTRLQIQELEATLGKERANILSRIANEYESTMRREQLLSAEFGNQTRLLTEQQGKGIQYDLLRREMETHRQFYDTMLQRMKSANLASAMRSNNVAIVDPAVEPSRPFKPDIPLNVALGFFAGAILGGAFVFLQEKSDRSLREPGDLLSLLKVPELGVIPAIANSHGDAAAVALRSQDGEFSVLTESFRMTLASILRPSDDQTHPTVILITSPEPRAGKTTTISNMAGILTRIGRRVILIDGDMRRPRLHLVFGLPNTAGLSDILRSPKPVGDSVRDGMVLSTAIDNLSILPSGCPIENPADLLYSPRLLELIQSFRRQFDTVLIDAPPLLSCPDARLLGRVADGAVLVCRSGETEYTSATAAIQRLFEDRIPVLGTILNHWKPVSDKYYSRHHYYASKG